MPTVVKIASFLRVFKNRRSKFFDHSEVFDTVDWLFKARSAQTIAYTLPKNSGEPVFSV